MVAAVAGRVDGFDGVTDEAVGRYHEHGYLVINAAFSASAIADALQALVDLIDGWSSGFNCPIPRSMRTTAGLGTRTTLTSMYRAEQR